VHHVHPDHDECGGADGGGAPGQVRGCAREGTLLLGQVPPPPLHVAFPDYSGFIYFHVEIKDILGVSALGAQGLCFANTARLSYKAS
jgi:hypothetical protein